MKGILKTFETVIGLSILMITFVTLFTSNEPLPEFDTVSWKNSGQNALQSLDASNLLRFDAMNNNTAVLETRLKSYLPPNVDVLVQTCSVINCTSPTINAKRSTSVHYIISGDSANSTASEVTLYVWSNE